MRKLLAGLSLCVGLIGGTSPGEAGFINGFGANQFDVPASGSLRAEDLRGPEVLVGEIPNPSTDWPIVSCFQAGFACSRGSPYWTLSADLRDANCPGCLFQSFSLPQTFDSLGDPTDGHWRVSNGIASAEMLPMAFVPIPGESFPGIRLEQDTTKVGVSCSQEYNVMVSKQRLGSFQSYGPRPEYVVSFYQQLEEVFQGSECPAPLNLASTLVGLQLRHNTIGDLFNFQVVTFDSRGAQLVAEYWSFPNTQGKPVYGVVDSLEVFGILPLQPGAEGRHILVDIAPRLDRHLKANPFGLDPNLANWEAFGLYGGSYTNGQAKIRSLLGYFR